MLLRSACRHSFKPPPRIRLCVIVFALFVVILLCRVEKGAWVKRCHGNASCRFVFDTGVWFLCFAVVRGVRFRSCLLNVSELLIITWLHRTRGKFVFTVQAIMSFEVYRRLSLCSVSNIVRNSSKTPPFYSAGKYIYDLYNFFSLFINILRSMKQFQYKMFY